MLAELKTPVANVWVDLKHYTSRRWREKIDLP